MHTDPVVIMCEEELARRVRNIQKYFACLFAPRQGLEAKSRRRLVIAATCYTKRQSEPERRLTTASDDVVRYSPFTAAGNAQYEAKLNQGDREGAHALT